MHLSDRRRYEMLVRVRDFGTTYGHLFPESSPAAQAFAMVKDALGDLEVRDVAETSASVAARATRKQQAREALRERLLLLGRTAKVLPGADVAFKAQFTLPASGNDALLLTVARRCIQRAGEVASQFTTYGMPESFLRDSTALLEQFETALRDRGMSRDQFVAARTGIKLALARSLKAVGELDVIVANHFASNAVVTEVWRRSRRIAPPPKPRKIADSGDASEPITAVANGGTLAA
jgi:hypothetical protein